MCVCSVREKSDGTQLKIYNNGYLVITIVKYIINGILEFFIIMGSTGVERISRISVILSTMES